MSYDDFVPRVWGHRLRGFRGLSPLKGLGSSAPKIVLDCREEMAILALQRRGREKQVPWDQPQ